MKKNLFLKILILTLLTMCSVISFGKTEVLSIYVNPMTNGYKSLEDGEQLLSDDNALTKIKFVAKVDEVTVEHNYVEWNEKTSYFYPIRTGFTIKPQKNVVYSFMGNVPEGIPEARLIINYKGKQKVIMLDWELETGDEGEELDHYDVYF